MVYFPGVFAFWPRNLGRLGFPGIFDFAVCGGVCVGFAIYSVILLHFRQKYRCVPKIGFSADIFLSFSFIFFRSIVVYLKLGSRLTFFVIFLHFLQKYCCVPKSGFSAVIFLTLSVIFFRSIVVYLQLGSRLTFFWHFRSFSSEVFLCT